MGAQLEADGDEDIVVLLGREMRDAVDGSSVEEVLAVVETRSGTGSTSRITGLHYLFPQSAFSFQNCEFLLSHVDVS